MDTGNPFAAFLAGRPPSAGKKSPTSYLGKSYATRRSATSPSGGAGGDGQVTLLPKDLQLQGFECFLAARPMHPTEEAEELSREVVRLKTELLRLALDSELKAIPDLGEGDEAVAARLRRVEAAKRCLEHPQLSRPPSRAGSVTAAVAHAPDDDRGAAAPHGESPPANAVPDAVVVHSDTKQRKAAARAQVEEAKVKAKHTRGVHPSVHETAAYTSERSEALARVVPGPYVPPVKAEVPLRGWCAEMKSFNVVVSTDRLVCTRRHCSVAGGSVMVGDGPIPLLSGSKVPVQGYYYAFEVQAVDDARSASSIAFGFSPISPREGKMTGFMCPIYAYEVPGVAVIGYGAQYIHKGRWQCASWDASCLARGDEVGVLLTLDGDLTILHKGAQVLRVPTSLMAATDVSEPPRLYPIVDLSGGRVGAVKLKIGARPASAPDAT